MPRLAKSLMIVHTLELVFASDKTVSVIRCFAAGQDVTELCSSPICFRIEAV